MANFLRLVVLSCVALVALSAAVSALEASDRESLRPGFRHRFLATLGRPFRWFRRHSQVARGPRVALNVVYLKPMGTRQCSTGEFTVVVHGTRLANATLGDLQASLARTFASSLNEPSSVLAIRRWTWRDRILLRLMLNRRVIRIGTGLPSSTPLSQVAKGRLLLFVRKVTPTSSCRGAALDPRPLFGVPKVGLQDKYTLHVSMDVLGLTPKDPSQQGEATTPAGERVSSYQAAQILLEGLPSFAIGDFGSATASLRKRPRKARDASLDRKVYTPSASQLALLLPSTTYFGVDVTSVEDATFRIPVSTARLVPSSSMSYICTGSQSHRLTHTGMNTLEEGVRGLGKKNKVNAGAELLLSLLAARKPVAGVSEQDPTVILLQLWRHPDGSETWQETPLIWEFPNTLEAFEEAVESRAGIVSRITANSRRIGKMAGWIVSRSFSRRFIRTLIQKHNINMEEAFSMSDPDSRHSAAEFRNLQEFFTRPINYMIYRDMDPRASIMSPADSLVQNVYAIRPNSQGLITHQIIPQVKSMSFNLQEFLFGPREVPPLQLQSPQNRLFVSIHYLAPSDYHRVHSPADWTVTSQTYIPGCTPSVSRKNLESGDLLQKYERTALVGHWDPENKGQQLFFSVTMVAAMFVGGLHLSWEEEPLGAQMRLGSCTRYTETFEKQVNVPLCASQELGAFRFGSTVVMIFEAPGDFDMTSLGQCSHVAAGQPAGYLGQGLRRPLQERCNAFRGNFDSSFQFLQHLKKTPDHDEVLKENTLAPRAWREEPGRVWREIVRATERGLLYGFPLSRYLLNRWALQNDNMGEVVLGQPAVLQQGVDGSDVVIREGFRCFATQNKTQMRLEMMGRQSQVSLFVRVSQDEQLLFHHPFYGCTGNEKLGKLVQGIHASWTLQPEHAVLLTLKVSTGSKQDDGRTLRVVNSTILVQTEPCQGGWEDSRVGTTSTTCVVRTVEKREDSSSETALTNEDL
uniref:phosphatidylserine decarboxylase n=1 Tax=Neospora caninum (strain Liverpool) TaxID=572307 RepID=A0A0F7UH27_NEOCL|nr:TPA: phosphatidylserine decarboxylase proenzyme,putative [Neospora caninum Liverpool]